MRCTAFPPEDAEAEVESVVNLFLFLAGLFRDTAVITPPPPPAPPAPIIFPDRVVIPYLGSDVDASFDCIFCIVLGVVDFDIVLGIIFDFDLDSPPAHTTLSSDLILSAKYLDGNLSKRNLRYSRPNSSSSFPLPFPFPFPLLCFGMWVCLSRLID